MTGTFSGCSVFNADLSGWNVSKVEGMPSMFFDCSSFNADLSGWNVSKVEGMSEMFSGCSVFNADLSGWDVSNVQDMSEMFDRCAMFNADLSGWDVSSVQSMNLMFYGCSAFNADLSGWDVSNVEYAENMFEGCPLDDPENAAKLPNFGGDDEPPSDIVYYVEPVPLKISSISSIPRDAIGKNYLTLDESNILKYVKEDSDNLVFILPAKKSVNMNYYLFSKEGLKESIMNQSNIKYGCNNVYNRLHITEDMYDADVHYLVLRSIGFPGGVVKLELIQKIIQDESIQMVEIVKTDDKLISTVSAQMLMPDPNAVGASRCQKGQDEQVYTLKKIVPYKRSRSTMRKRSAKRGTRSLSRSARASTRGAEASTRGAEASTRSARTSTSHSKTKKVAKTL
jgi:surface protein